MESLFTPFFRAAARMAAIVFFSGAMRLAAAVHHQALILSPSPAHDLPKLGASRQRRDDRRNRIDRRCHELINYFNVLYQQ